MRRKDLIKALDHLKIETGSIACLGCGHEHNCGTQGCAIIRAAAEELASADVRPVVRGHWVPIDDFPHEDWECDVCGAQLWGDEYIPHTFKFCHNCGADMREARD